MIDQHQPVDLPTGLRQGTWRDYGAVLRISLDAQLIATWQQVSIRIVTVLLLGFLVLLCVALASLFELSPLGVVAVVLAVLVVLCVFIVAMHLAARMADGRRAILLATDRRASVDVRFRRDGTISLSNHGRTFRATSASELRARLAEWLRDSGSALKISAQNRRVSAIYMAQFPELHETGKDWMGHVILAIRT